MHPPYDRGRDAPAADPSEEIVMEERGAVVDLVDSERNAAPGRAAVEAVAVVDSRGARPEVGQEAELAPEPPAPRGDRRRGPVGLGLAAGRRVEGVAPVENAHG